jgi:hypothetical protein
MVLMLGIGESGEEVFIAGGAADVLGRAAAFDFEKDWVIDTENGVVYPFDFDRMLPAIAKIIDVLKRLRANIFEHVDEPGLAGIERAAAPVWIGNAPSNVFGPDLVKVGCWSSLARPEEQDAGDQVGSSEELPSGARLWVRHRRA